MKYENLRLFEPGDPTGGRSFPLVNLGDTIYRMSITSRWQPRSGLANVAYEVTDDATGELIAWGLVPRTDSEQELGDEFSNASLELANLRYYLAEPFPSEELHQVASAVVGAGSRSHGRPAAH